SRRCGRTCVAVYSFVMQPGSPEWHARIERLLTEEANQPMRHWYLSFVDGHFLGGAIVEARGFTSALQRTHELGINPGGEVLHVLVPEEKVHLIHPSQKNRLLTKSEVERLWNLRRIDRGL